MNQGVSQVVNLADQPWLTWPATRAVIAALEAAGGPGCVRFVGGCVRNALVGQGIDDIDLATRLLPVQTMAALKTAGLKVVPTGIDHGTVTGVSQRIPYEITTLRRDVSTDGRNATVAFTDDWAEDAARRDFRLNALYCDAEGVIFDPTGAGVADALAGRIVFVGDAATRIREDYLRILRFFRFYAWYGRAEPDAEGLAACAAEAEGMVRLSAERVSKELLKLLAAPDPRRAVRAMAETGVLARVIAPDLSADGPGGGLTVFEAMVEVSQDPVLRLSALLTDEAAGIAAAAVALRLPNAMRDRLLAAAAGDVVALEMSEAEARAVLYRVGRQAFVDRVARAEAKARNLGGGRRLVDLAERWPIPRLPVGGRQAAAAGLEPGPDTGRVLKAFEDGWVADDFPDHGHAERLKALIASIRGALSSGPA